MVVPLDVDGVAFFIAFGAQSLTESQLVHYWTMSESKGHSVCGQCPPEHRSVQQEMGEVTSYMSSARPAGRTWERWKKRGAAEELGGFWCRGKWGLPGQASTSLPPVQAGKVNFLPEVSHPPSGARDLCSPKETINLL